MSGEFFLIFGGQMLEKHFQFSGQIKNTYHKNQKAAIENSFKTLFNNWQHETLHNILINNGLKNNLVDSCENTSRFHQIKPLTIPFQMVCSCDNCIN